MRKLVITFLIFCGLTLHNALANQNNVTFSITNQWQGGFQGQLSTPAPYNNFLLSFTYSTAYKVTSAWPGTLTKSCSPISCSYIMIGKANGNPISIGFTAVTTKTPAAPFFIFVTQAPPPPPPPFPTPTHYTAQPYRGVNLSGGDFDGSQPLWPYPTDAMYFVQKGMNTVRLPFRWEYLEPNNDPSKTIDFTVAGSNAKALADLVKIYTAAGMNVILDMHNYMRYQSLPISGNGGTLITPNSSLATTIEYARAWGDIANAFKNNPHVIFDLMNEPHDMDTQLVFSNYTAAIKSVRATGANNLILLEGNNWSGLHSWTTDTGTDGKTNAQVFTKEALDKADSAKNYAINVHQYFDSNFSGTSDCVADASADALYNRIDYGDFINYLKNNDINVIVTEMGGTNIPACAQDIKYFLDLVTGNTNEPVMPNNFIGWTGWAAGQAWGGGYNYYLGPAADGTEKLTMHYFDPQQQQLYGFEEYLTPPTSKNN